MRQLRATVLAVVVCSLSLGAKAANESLWLRCSVSRNSRDANESQLKTVFSDEHLFVTISAKDDKTPMRLLVTIWSDHFIGTNAYYSWSGGPSPDVVTADVGKFGWMATRQRLLDDGTVWSGQLSIDRNSGAYHETSAILKDGVAISENLYVGRCEPTRRWVDKNGLLVH